jgi:hypothetical protein
VWRAFAGRGLAVRAPAVSGGAVRGLLVLVSIGGGAALALALLSVIERWHRGPFG